MTQQNQQTPQMPQSQPQPLPLPQQMQQQPQQIQQPQQPQPMPQQMQHSQPQPPTQSPISFNAAAPQPAQEPAQKPNAWDSIIQQQQEQINALMAQNQALTGQITQMVQGGGAQFTQQPQPQPHQVQQVPQVQQPTEFPPVYDGASPLAMFNPPALSDNQDYSLEGLASEIGKPADKS